MRIKFLAQNRMGCFNNAVRPAFKHRLEREYTASFDQNDFLPDFRPVYYTYHPLNDSSKVHDIGIKYRWNADDFISKSLESEAMCGEGGEACVFNIAGLDNYVLRIPKILRARFAAMADCAQSAIIPVLYDEKLFNKRNLGLPLYVIKDYSKVNEGCYEFPCFPDKMPDEKEFVTILRKMPGDTIAGSYKNSLEKFVSVGQYYNPEREQEFDLFLNAIRSSKNRNDAFIKCKDLMQDKRFARDYSEFADKYIKRLEEIAMLPKEAYDKALKLIDEADGYTLDFKNSDNILIDIDKQEFNFVDLQFDPAVSCFYECDDVKKAFRDTILGDRQFYVYTFDYPGELLIKPSDFNRFLRLKSVIDKKCGITDEFECN